MMRAIWTTGSSGGAPAVGERVGDHRPDDEEDNESDEAHAADANECWREAVARTIRPAMKARSEPRLCPGVKKMGTMEIRAAGSRHRQLRSQCQRLKMVRGTMGVSAREG